MPTEPTNNIDKIDTLINNFLPENNRAIAKGIARCVLAMKNDYPDLDFKAYKTGNEDIIDDIRFCFDRGNDLNGNAIITSFIIIKKNMDIYFSFYGETPAEIRGYFTRHSSVNKWDVLNINYENVLSIIPRIIYLSFIKEAEKFGLQKAIPPGILNKNLKAIIDNKSTIIPSEEIIENIIKNKNIYDADEIFKQIEQHSHNAGYHLAEGWQETIKNRYKE